VLEDKDILQVDATIITGILIMLSITGFIGSGVGKTSFTGLASLVSIILIPFSVSAVLVVQLERMKPSYVRRVKSISLTHGIRVCCSYFSLYIIFLVPSNPIRASFKINMRKFRPLI
jgi:ABC-type sulfate transport system permease subunit